MSIPLVQNNEKDSINTSIIAIKRNIERINMLLGLSNSEEIDTSKFATKEELQQAVTDLQPVDEVTSGNMHSVTSNAVAETLSNYSLKYKRITGITNANGVLWAGNSNIVGNECFVFSNCVSHTDYMVITGYGGVNGVWLKIANYDYTAIINTTVSLDTLCFIKNA